jgi:hypothetical protein
MRRTPHLALAAPVLGLALASTAVGQDAACPLDYPTYEPAVPHLDMESCPPSMDVSDAYCRVSLSAEIATVYAFSDEDDCLVGSRAYFEDEYTLTIE